MRQQGAWTKWEQAMEWNITWNDLWKMDPHSIKSLIQAVYNILPSPSNLHCWGLADWPACPFCEKTGMLGHILSCCWEPLPMVTIVGGMTRSSRQLLRPSAVLSAFAERQGQPGTPSTLSKKKKDQQNDTRGQHGRSLHRTGGTLESSCSFLPTSLRLCCGLTHQSTCLCLLLFKKEESYYLFLLNFGEI